MRNLFDVCPVGGGKEDVFDPMTARCQDLLPYAADGQDLAPKGYLPCHGDTGKDAPAAHRREDGCCHGHTGGGPVLGDCPLRNVDMNVDGLPVKTGQFQC